MTDTGSPLLALADRCEREVPDPYLASAILVALGNQTLFRGPNLGWEWRPDGIGIWRSMPRPDLSIDQAVLVVPEFWGWALETGDRAKALVHNRNTLFRGDRHVTMGMGCSPSLALCAAALRARAALEDGAAEETPKVRTL
jgi:hypothetical protein